MTMVDATNLLDANEKASSERKKSLLKKKNKGTELAHLINKLEPTTLSLGELLIEKKVFSHLPNTRPGRSSAMELKKKVEIGI